MDQNMGMGFIPLPDKFRCSRQVRLEGTSRLVNGHEVLIPEESLNTKLMGKPVLARRQYLVPFLTVVAKSASNPTGVSELLLKTSENDMLVNRLSFQPATETSTREVKCGNGKVVRIQLSSKYMMEDTPTIIYVSLVPDPGYYGKKWQQEAYERSQQLLIKGFSRRGVKYEYATRSSSQKMSGKAIFVRTDYRIRDEILAETLTPEEKAEWTAFRGTDALLTVLSYGQWPEWKKTGGNLDKIMTRIANALSSSKAIGKDLSIRVIGSISIPWSPKLEEMMVGSLISDGVSEKSARASVAIAKTKWKMEKGDGQSMISAESVLSMLQEMGLKMDMKDIVGQVLQIRYGPLKGTLFCAPRVLMDQCQFPDGSYAYRGFDLIAEGSSWKHNYNSKVFKGVLAPALCLLAMSKQKSSNSIHSMAWMNLDGENGDANTIFPVMQELVNETISGMKEACTEGYRALSRNGVITYVQAEEENSVDAKQERLNSPALGAIDAYNLSVKDLSVRMKLWGTMLPMVKDAWSGRMDVEGATKLVITDPSLFFLTNKAIKVLKKDGTQDADMFGNPLWNIVVEDPDDAMLSGIKDCYWDGKVKAALLFRSPCMHPGEPQLVNLVDASKKMVIKFSEDNVMDLTDLLKSFNKVLVVNAFCNILEALGGAE